MLLGELIDVIAPIALGLLFAGASTVCIAFVHDALYGRDRSEISVHRRP